MRRMCLTLVLLASAAGFASAADIDNPEFAAWAKFNKGASVTKKTIDTVADSIIENTTTLTLVEVGADKLVLEDVTVGKTKGGETKLPPMKRTIPKTLKLPAGAKADDFKGGKPKGTYEEGTETVKAGGAEIKTTWYKAKTESNGVKTETKTWVSDDVPGGVVKLERTIVGALTTTRKTDLVEFKKP